MQHGQLEPVLKAALVAMTCNTRGTVAIVWISAS